MTTDSEIRKYDKIPPVDDLKKIGTVLAYVLLAWGSTALAVALDTNLVPAMISAFSVVILVAIVQLQYEQRKRTELLIEFARGVVRDLTMKEYEANRKDSK